MKRKNHPALSLATIFILMVSSLSGCIIFGGQTIYEDPDYVDFDPEAPPKNEDDLAKIYGDGPYIQAGDIRVYYDPSVENYVDDFTDTVPSSPGKEAYEVAHPDYSVFIFSVMQTEVYAARMDLYESATDFAPAIIADLQRLIASSDDFGDCVPELPLEAFYKTCEHQQFVSNAKRIAFGNGSGVRFVTTYAIQDLTGVGNDNLVYVFQGFTDDGRYYVKAVVEMMHSSLGGIGKVPADVYAADTDGVQEYFGKFADTFNSDEKGFTPDLDWIDEVIGALSFE